MMLEEARGLFGPGSLAWKVDREVVVLAGGSCALLMQAAHPVVAAGVVQHSTYATDPFGRLARTLTSSFDVVFGTRAQASAAISRVNAIHRSVRGRRPDDGSPYSAADPDAMLWVHATLIDTALRIYGRFVGPLTAEEEQAYHDEARQVAELLGIAPERLPSTIGDLRAWMDAMLVAGEIRVTPAAREIARTVLYPVRWMPRGAWDLAHLVSMATLPAALRRQYGIGWSAAREHGIERLAAISRRALPLVPAPLRYAPQARRAERRVSQAVDATTR